MIVETLFKKVLPNLVEASKLLNQADLAVGAVNEAGFKYAFLVECMHQFEHVTFKSEFPYIGKRSLKFADLIIGKSMIIEFKYIPINHIGLIDVPFPPPPRTTATVAEIKLYRLQQLVKRLNEANVISNSQSKTLLNAKVFEHESRHKTKSEMTLQHFESMSMAQLKKYKVGEQANHDLLLLIGFGGNIFAHLITNDGGDDSVIFPTNLPTLAEEQKENVKEEDENEEEEKELQIRKLPLPTPRQPVKKDQWGKVLETLKDDPLPDIPAKIDDKPVDKEAPTKKCSRKKPPPPPAPEKDNWEPF